MADMSLCTFLDTHLEVDRVAYDVDFSRFKVIEQVTVVPIVVANGIVVFLQAFVELLLVINITFLHAQRSVQIVCRNHGVAHPGNVTQIIALSFFQFDIDVDVFLINSPYGVFQDGSVTKTQLVILVDKSLLSLVITLWCELLWFEEILELTSLINFAERAFLEQRALDLAVF